MSHYTSARIFLTTLILITGILTPLGTTYAASPTLEALSVTLEKLKTQVTTLLREKTQNAAVTVANVPMSPTPRRLTECTYSVSFVPSEATPFLLDWCTLKDGDDITTLLVDVTNKWPSSLYMRAPAQNLTLYSDTINWATTPIVPVKTFVFQESTVGNTLTIKHKNPSTDKNVMWRFYNFDTVKIGGINRLITFVGTHPGLGNGNPNVNAGLLHFYNEGTSYPKLVDVRANVHHAQDYGLFIHSDGQGTTFGGTRNRVQQVNLSGLYWNAAIGINSVKNVWLDKDNLRVSDPYQRVFGWDGAIAKIDGAQKVGCFDETRKQVRTTGAGAAQYVDSITGGVTLEYGNMTFIPRVTRKIGNSVEDPLVVRVKDWGVSGPEALTGYPSGVVVKKPVQAILFKGDPHEAFTNPDGSTGYRYIRFEKLPSDFGDGMYARSGLTGCAPGNTTNNNYADGNSNLMRLESGRGSGYLSINANWDVQFAGDWTTNFVRGPLFYTASELRDSPGPTEPDRSYGHIIRLNAGMTMTDTVNMHDINTFTGVGTWTNITVAPVITNTGKPVPPKDNKILDTNVRGFVKISPDSGNTIIRNVDFTASGTRTILDIGSNSTADIANICVSKDSKITGTGTVTYNGTLLTLPYTFTTATDCVKGVVAPVIKSPTISPSKPPAPTVPTPSPQTPPVITTPSVTQTPRYQTTEALRVRATPSTSGTSLGTQPKGAQGTRIGAPVTADNVTWYNMNYEQGVDGWSASTYLTSVTPGAVAQTPTTPTLTCTPAFTTGTSVLITAKKTKVYNEPNGKSISSRSKNAKGTITSSICVGTTTWYKIDFPKGKDGYVQEGRVR